MVILSSSQSILLERTAKNPDSRIIKHKTLLHINNGQVTAYTLQTTKGSYKVQSSTKTPYLINKVSKEGKQLCAVRKQDFPKWAATSQEAGAAE